MLSLEGRTAIMKDLARSKDDGKTNNKPSNSINYANKQSNQRK